MAKTAEDGCWVGFDLGGTKMLAQVYDNSLKLLGKDRKKTKPASDVSAGIGRIIETIREALTAAQIDPRVWPASASAARARATWSAAS